MYFVGERQLKMFMSLLIPTGIVIMLVFGYNNYLSFPFINPLIESLLFIVSGIFSLFLIFKHRLTFNNICFHLFALVIVAYIITKDLCLNYLSLSSLISVLKYYIFFVAINLWFLSTRLENRVLLFDLILRIWATLQIVVSIIAIVWYDFKAYFIPNSSILSILLAGFCSYFVTKLVLKSQTNSNKHRDDLFDFSLAFCCFILLIFTGGRAGWLGLAISAFVSIFIITESRKHRLFLAWIALPCLFLLLVWSVFYFKAGSSNGRILIYKVSSGFLANTSDVLLGIGNNHFQQRYNLQQAEYFSKNGIDSEEALLADNTYFAFNEFWQFFLENGLIGICLVVVIGIIWIRNLFKIICSDYYRNLVVPAASLLLCLFTSSLFNYTFHVNPTIILSGLTLSFVNSLFWRRHQFEVSKLLRKLLFCLVLILCAALIYFYTLEFRTKKAASKALIASRLGYKTQAVNSYVFAHDVMPENGPLLLSFARDLMYIGQFAKAKQVVEEAKNRYSSNDVYSLSGQIEMALNNFELAEHELLTSVRMVPNRLITRFNLMNFYLEIAKDTGNAVLWAESICNMKVKIWSSRAAMLQQKARHVLQLRKVAFRCIRKTDHSYNW